MKRQMKLLIVVNVDWAFITHRLPIAEEAVNKGWKVYVAAKDTGRAKDINNKIEFINFEFSRSGTNPIKELYSFVKFLRLYRRIKPDVIHHVTLKPVIYGSFAARLTRIRGVLNAISGLGYTFTGEMKGVKGLISKIMVSLMRFGFNSEKMAFVFQNNDDYEELEKLNVFSKKNSFHFIKGVGVNLDEFKFSPIPNNDKTNISIVTRMLWDKGIAELKKASEILKVKYYKKITFTLVGIADEDNKAGVSEKFLKDWEDGEYVKWIGYQTNVVKIYSESDIVTLPSYREGIPRALIEACSIGRPIVTTNAIGCRECVDEGINGFKVPIKSCSELAEAFVKLIEDKELQRQMGKASRIKAEKEFDVEDVKKKHLTIYESLCNE